MSTVREPRHPALRGVYWREEVVEVVLWLRGEGLDDRVDARRLCHFLGIDHATAVGLLDRLTVQGYLQRTADGRYELSAEGEEEGQRITGWSRAVPAPTAGPCGPQCWCSRSPAEAWRCD